MALLRNRTEDKILHMICKNSMDPRKNKIFHLDVFWIFYLAVKRLNNPNTQSFTLTSEVPDFFQGLEEQWAETKEKNEEANKQTKKKTKEWF
ncbi:3689_t:CDS:2 [Funneliformis geosporum]|uniref:3689_t:CDS:1 n=1 Tax=Funneliformis geosporum TaxID=1117311 RepID=A0A9W4WLH5_9GLOM|nr:3689_t:CDS:2 [Funneliformis geosporum]